MDRIETTLCLLKRDNKILLAMKKRGFGKGKYNGIGGKIEKNETPEQAMIRETQEEINVTPIKYEKIGIVEFDEYYKGKKQNLIFYLYFIHEWKGIPSESNEMKPEWFDIDSIPYEKMFPDDKHWLPLVLEGKKIKAYFEFDENWNLISKVIDDLNKNVTIVIDGQAGSCGKGKIGGYLAKKEKFEISTNNWSSNAGHTFVDNNGNKVIVSHLPIAIVNPKTKLLINAGAIITPEILGKICLKAILGLLSPKVLAAKTKSLSLYDKVMFRTCLAIEVQPVKAIDKIIAIIPFPNKSPNMVTIIRFGTEEIISIIRCIMISTAPPT